MAWKDTPSSARLDPNDRERSLTATTVCSMTLSLHFLLHVRGFGVVGIHGQLAFPDHAQNVVRGEVQLVRLGQQGVDALLDDAAPLPKRELWTRVRDERARAAALVHDPRDLEIA